MTPQGIITNYKRKIHNSDPCVLYPMLTYPTLMKLFLRMFSCGADEVLICTSLSRAALSHNSAAQIHLKRGSNKRAIHQFISDGGVTAVICFWMLSRTCLKKDVLGHTMTDICPGLPSHSFRSLRRWIIASICTLNSATHTYTEIIFPFRIDMIKSI